MTEADGELVTTLKFSGGQFDLTGFPAARAEELSHYRQLFIAAAKTVWRRKNPGRRLPRGFEDGIRLSFTFEEGSTMATAIYHGMPGEQLELESIPSLAQDRIDAIFRRIVSNQDLSDVEDHEIPCIKRIGGTFDATEMLTFRQRTNTPISYSVTDRERLLAALCANSMHATVIGRVVALDANCGFAVKPITGGKKIPGKYTEERLFPELHAVLALNTDNAASLMWLDCEVELSPKTGRPRAISDVFSVGVFPPVHAEDAADIARLAEHDDGWFDGEGTRISPDTLENAVTLINELRAARIPRPVIGGDPDGGVTLHWINDPVAVVVTVEPDNTFTAIRTNVDTHEREHTAGLVGAAAAAMATQQLLKKHT